MDNGKQIVQVSPDEKAFALRQREAQLFASSDLIPPHLRGKMADVYIALQMANAMGENPVVVMQSIYVVSGKAGWSAAYMIARANRSGIFKGRINWRTEGRGETLVVTAYATLADTSEVVEASASMAMAKAEGWTRNPKYQTMGEHMLRFRAATMLIRLFAPEVMLGYQTVDEIEDVNYASRNAPVGRLAELVDAEVVAPQLPDPKKQAEADVANLRRERHRPDDFIPSDEPMDGEGTDAVREQAAESWAGFSEQWYEIAKSQNADPDAVTAGLKKLKLQVAGSAKRDGRAARLELLNAAAAGLIDWDNPAVKVEVAGGK